jgi:3-oxoacyl-(acyl-carrier-protein) synthase
VTALRKALAMADVDPSSVDYVNAHATATKGGDGVEVATLKQVLGASVQDTYVSGTKALHGHMLGAASAMEMLVSLLALREQFVPGTAFLEELDPECEGLRHVPQTLQGVPLSRALSLSAGFGGTNAALLLKRA